MIDWDYIEEMISQGKLHQEILFLEYKKAKNAVPKDFWKSYSAFANSKGGFIILGIEENESKDFSITGVKDYQKIIDDIFSQSRSREKVSSPLLTSGNIRHFLYQGNVIVVVYIPTAQNVDRPVHLNQDIRQSYVRLHSGDHKLTDSELRTMLSSYAPSKKDYLVLANTSLADINLDTLNKYRNSLKAHNPDSELLYISDLEFAEKVGVLSRDASTQTLGVTYAGLLLFGKEYRIKHYFPHFFFEYYEKMDENSRYDLRITDFDLSEGNLFEFYLKIAPLVTELGKDSHFKLDNLTRTGENEITKALREALVNAIAHADYFNDVRYLKIIKLNNQISFENAGIMLVDIDQAIAGNRSECRNSLIHNLLRRIGLCERQGQGVKDIFIEWKNHYFNVPVLESQIDHTKLILTFHDEKISKWQALLSKNFKLFDKLNPCQKDCLLYIAVNQGRSKYKPIAEKITHYSNRDITLALSALVKKGFLFVIDGKRYEREYCLTGYNKEKDDLSNQCLDVDDQQVKLRTKNNKTDNNTTELSEKPTELSEKPTELSEKPTELSEKPTKLSEKNKKISKIDVTIDVLCKHLGKRSTLEQINNVILLLCLEQASSAEVIAKRLKRNQDYLSKNYLKKLIESNELRFLYPERLNHPEQAYCLTDKGRKLLIEKGIIDDK
ncbi:RNA-binding domain-containing protein [Gallibacterium anatis]|uniref:RNA-binding domain-containing protein n=1 Tax=Gallibacterium anatis TaxID=750 RepID=UPI000531AEC0|nr:RNA-binding domain-containing protein [Gallibacterium anatis]KGQ55432.1 transcriptional regulator [Gallibacterium anatis str. Avicor]OZN48844.1 transcriptional regulator [Gallibacterium anatis]